MSLGSLHRHWNARGVQRQDKDNVRRLRGKINLKHPTGGWHRLEGRSSRIRGAVLVPAGGKVWPQERRMAWGRKPSARKQIASARIPCPPISCGARKRKGL